MKKNAIFILLFVLLIFSHPFYSFGPKSFSKSKKIAGNLFSEHRVTLYCQCRYDENSNIDLSSCGMQSASYKVRAHRVEWEHMMPAENFGRQFKCWREYLCKKNGKSYRGRKCCSETDKAYKKVEGELYNLWPSEGLINQLRSNYRYANISNKKLTYGCEFYADKSLRKAEPSGYAKGIVARANLFMADHYGIKLSKRQHYLFEIWNKKYPATEFERKWSHQIAQIEGYHNPYIQ